MKTRVLVALLMLLASAGTVEAQRIRSIDTVDSTKGRLILSRGLSEAHADCPTSVYQFSLDSGQDRDWTKRNRLSWDEENLTQVVREAVAIARAALPGPAPDICLGIASPPGNDPTLARLGGVGGAAFVGQAIVLVVAPALNADWLSVLAVTIAHEYHHMVAARPATDGTEVLIREGLANHFAATIFPDILHPPTSALDTSQFAPVWATIREHLNDRPAEFLRSYMFGGPHFGGEVPRWAGYTLGYCLVSTYAELHPGLSLAALAVLPADEFITIKVGCH